MGKEDGCVTWAPRRGLGSAGHVCCQQKYSARFVLKCFDLRLICLFDLNALTKYNQLGLLGVGIDLLRMIVALLALLPSGLWQRFCFVFFYMKSNTRVPKQNSNTKCSSSFRLSNHLWMYTDVSWEKTGTCRCRKLVKRLRVWTAGCGCENCGKQPRSFPFPWLTDVWLRKCGSWGSC